MRTSIFVLLLSLTGGAFAHADSAPRAAKPEVSREIESLRRTHGTLVSQMKVFASRKHDSLTSAREAKASAERYERLRTEAASKPEHAAVFHELATKERSKEKGQRAYAVVVSDAHVAHAAEAKRLQLKIDALSK